MQADFGQDTMWPSHRNCKQKSKEAELSMFYLSARLQGIIVVSDVCTG